MGHSVSSCKVMEKIKEKQATEIIPTGQDAGLSDLIKTAGPSVQETEKTLQQDQSVLTNKNHEVQQEWRTKQGGKNKSRLEEETTKLVSSSDQVR